MVLAKVPIKVEIVRKRCKCGQNKYLTNAESNLAALVDPELLALKAMNILSPNR